MSLKQIINRQKMLNDVIDKEMELPGEPLIYSIKYPVGQRTRGVQFFRNMQWKSLLKTFFRSFYRTNIPVVLIVRFFVTPPEGVSVSPKALRQESLPAVKSYELCDYTLSFLEMLHHVLFNSYRQVVKLDVEKFYSANPRTTVKMMKWDEYVKLQSSNTIHTKAESVSENVKRPSVQSKRKRNETSSRACKEAAKGPTDAASQGSAVCDSSLRDAGSSRSLRKKTPSAKLLTPHEATRRRQLREVPQ